MQVGVMKARKISHAYSLPLVPIHHMEAHALVARLNVEAAVRFPFLCLLVSGGHNLLLIVHSVGRYTQLGTTLDDSLGMLRQMHLLYQQFLKAQYCLWSINSCLRVLDSFKGEYPKQQMLKMLPATFHSIQNNKWFC